MSKYTVLVLFLVTLFSATSCIPKTSNKDNTSGNTPLAAVTIPDKVEELDALIDYAYETSILEADLPSPRKEMSGHIDDINIKINYGSPSVKGRAVWGGLVPYDKVWRTGANEATRFTTDKNILINGQKISAGTYGLFTLPGKDGAWKIIFNKTAQQWGAYEYDENQDVLRVSSSAEATEKLSETMEFIIDRNKVVVLWEKLKVAVAINPVLE